jgi:outer membrane protein
MRSSLSIGAALCATHVALAPSATLAQTASPATGAATRAAPDTSPARGPVLSLDEAIALALKNNPDYLSTMDARRAASAQRRAAYGGFLPSASASLQGQYQQSGSNTISGVAFDVNSDIYQSFYSISLGYSLSANTFLNPRIQSANVRAADADIRGSAQLTRATVAQNYIAVLQSQAKAALSDSLVTQSQVQLELAKAKVAVGSGTQLDISQAEVALGRARVASLQAHNQVQIDKLRLFQAMGVPEPADVQLTTEFEVREPAFTLDSVLALARQQNPALNALRSRDQVASLNVRSAQSQYLPTLRLATGIGGYTYQYANGDYPVQLAQNRTEQSRASCFTTDSIRVGAGLPSIAGQCAAMQFTPQMAAQIRSQNSQFPFSFTRQPWSLSATISLPIFDNFQREARIEQAQVDRNAARYRIRKQELQLTADVTSAYLTLVTNARTVALQEQNSARAREELQLAQERYRVGAATYLDLANARANYETAENDRINAIYTYHISFAVLENAVGRPLR